MIPLASKLPQQAKKALGSGGGKTQRAAEAFVLAAACCKKAAALARLFFNMEESQSASEMMAIRTHFKDTPSMPCLGDLVWK
jgi:hypothetical protein